VHERNCIHVIFAKSRSNVRLARLLLPVIMMVPVSYLGGARLREAHSQQGREWNPTPLASNAVLAVDHPGTPSTRAATAGLCSAYDALGVPKSSGAFPPALASERRSRITPQR